MNPQQQERRDYNDDIETTVLELVGLSAKIKTYYHGGLVQIDKVAEEFYFQFNVLLGLVSPLTEMKDADEVSDKIGKWLERRVKDSETQAYLLEGTGLFKEYHAEISKAGLLALPSTKGR